MRKFSKYFYVTLIVLSTACSNKDKILEGSVNILSQSQEVLKVDSNLSDKFFAILDAEKFSDNSVLAANTGAISFSKIQEKKLKKKAKKYSKVKTPYPFFIEPLVIDQKAYLLNAEGSVFLYDLVTNKVIWEQKLTEDLVDINALKGGIRYHGGRIYITNGTFFLSCLEAQTGEILWQKNLSFISRGAPLVAGQRVFVNTINNKILVFDAISGKKQWLSEFVDQQSSLYGNSSFVANDKILAAGNNNGDVIVYDLVRGAQVWQDNLADINVDSESFNFNDIDANPVIYNNKLFVVSSDGYLASYELLSGIRDWDIKISAYQTPWVTNNLIFIIDTDYNLVAISTVTGKIKWIERLEDYIKDDEERFFYGPVVAGNNVLVSSNKGKMLVFDFNNGELVNKIKIPKNINHTPVVANNQIYLVNNKSKLYKLY